MYKVSARQYLIINALRKFLEKRIVPVGVNELAEEVNVAVHDIMRDLAELEMKEVVKLHRSTKYFIRLSELGVNYLSDGLPEQKMFLSLLDLNSRGVKRLSVEELLKTTNLSRDEFSAVLGILRRYNVISVSRNQVELLLDDDKVAMFNSYLNELTSLLMRFKEGLSVDVISEELLSIRRRGFIDINEVKELKVELTNAAINALSNNLIVTKEVITALTSDLISSYGWMDVEFKEFDLSIDVPLVYPSRKHPYTEFLNYVREVVVSMGFEEMKGPHIEFEFWNFDVLYLPQYHPARSVNDVYFITHTIKSAPKAINEILDSVKNIHERGDLAKSIGWGYRWDPKKALRLILRTHTTSVSMRTIYERGEGEYRCFSLDRVFRPDTPDPTHLMEFHQLEGIIVGKNVAFKHLLGFFKEFSKRLGLGDVLFRPAYFPFTEPSVEGYVKHPRLGWIEVFPGGMFRPEVLKPLKVVNCNVAAWGIGIDRIAMMVLNIDDIRDLYTNSLEVIKKLRIPKVMLGG